MVDKAPKSTSEKAAWMRGLLLSDQTKYPEVDGFFKAAELAVDITELVVEPLAAPLLVLKDFAQKIAEGFAIEKFTVAGLGFFKKTEAEKHLKSAQLKYEAGQQMLVKLSQTAWMCLWGGVTHGLTAVLAGVVGIMAVAKYLADMQKVAKLKRWEDVVASMMVKYENILNRRELGIARANARRAGVEEIRKQAEFEQDQKAGKETIKGTIKETSRLDLTNFRIYADYALGINTWMYDQKFVIDSMSLVPGIEDEIQKWHKASNEYEDKYAESLQKQRKLIRDYLYAKDVGDDSNNTKQK